VRSASRICSVPISVLFRCVVLDQGNCRSSPRMCRRHPVAFKCAPVHSMSPLARVEGEAPMTDYFITDSVRTSVAETRAQNSFGLTFLGGK
jgi:hypothetical protein